MNIITNLGYTVEICSSIEKSEQSNEKSEQSKKISHLEVLVDSKTCHICCNTYETQLTCRNCTCIYCPKCYFNIVESYNHCSICKMVFSQNILKNLKISEQDALEHCSKTIKVLCPENSCHLHFSLNAIDEHILKNHSDLKKIPEHIEEDKEREKYKEELDEHIKVIDSFFQQRLQEEAEAALSRKLDEESLKGYEDLSENIIRISGVIKHLNSNERADLIKSFFEGFQLTDKHILSDTLQISKMIDEKTSNNEESLPILASILVNIIEKKQANGEHLNYHEFQDSYQKLFPEYNQWICDVLSSSSQDLDKERSVAKTLTDLEFRRERIKLMDFMLSCNADKLEHIEQSLSIDGINQSKDLDMRRSQIIAHLCFEETSLDVFLLQFDTCAYRYSGLARNITSESDLVINGIDIKSKLDTPIGANKNEESKMFYIINQALTRGQRYLLTLLLVDSYAAEAFYENLVAGLFRHLIEDSVKVKNLIFALVDSRLLYADTVEEAIANCYVTGRAI